MNKVIMIATVASEPEQTRNGVTFRVRHGKDYFTINASEKLAEVCFELKEGDVVHFDGALKNTPVGTGESRRYRPEIALHYIKAQKSRQFNHFEM